jgi:hypothetical protein
MSRTKTFHSPPPCWHEGVYFRAVLWICIAAAFTALVVQYSRLHGKLLCPPFYDDVAYFEDALRRLALLERSGPLVLTNSNCVTTRRKR